MPWYKEVKAHNAQGFEFKLHPRRVNRSIRQFITEHLEMADLARQVWLWLEGRRLKQTFASVREYALSSVAKCPDQPPLRSALLTARTFGPRAIMDSCAFRYPRERLL